MDPKVMTPSLVTILHDAFKKALADPEFLESIKAQGLAFLCQGPEDLPTLPFVTMI
jgi:tripartite-type tricarboxylate transporter receptor subunit TctC